MFPLLSNSTIQVFLKTLLHILLQVEKGFEKNPSPHTPPRAEPSNQYSNPSTTPPDPYYTGDETEIYPEDSGFRVNSPPQKICQKCQTEVSSEAKFCQRCGNWI